METRKQLLVRVAAVAREVTTEMPASSISHRLSVAMKRLRGGAHPLDVREALERVAKAPDPSLLGDVIQREEAGIRARASRQLAVYDLVIDEHDNIVPRTPRRR